MDDHECGFTCLACGQFRPGPEGAHSESACLRVQLAALKAKLAKYTVPLTDNQVASLADDWALPSHEFKLIDASIRRVRRGE